MKVLQIVPEMHVGGVETGTLDLAKALIRAGHEAFVISHGGVLVKDLQNAGVRHYQMPVHKKSLWTICRMIFKVRRLIRVQNIDIVHTRSRVPAWIAYFAVRKTQTRWVSTVHGHYSPHFFSRVVGRAETVIAISSAVRDHCVQKLRIDAALIKVIPRGVDLAHLDRRFEVLNQDCVRIGIVGRLVPLKGHDVFLKAICLLQKKHPNIKAYIIGEPASGKENYYAMLKTMVSDFGLDEKIVFLEGKRDLIQIYQHLDLLVLSSIKPEGFGRTVIEAQALGIPVVAAGLGGVLDIIEDGVNGLLVKPSNPEDLSKALLKLLQNPQYARQLADHAYQNVRKNFSLDRMTDHTINLYAKLLKRPRILLIKLGALGDLILAAPSFKALRQFYPDGRISLLVREKHAEIFTSCPYVDEVIPYYGTCDFIKKIFRFRGLRFDTALDLQNNKTSHWVSFLSRIPVRIGYARGGRGFLLTHRTSIQKNIGPIESQAQVLSLAGISIEDMHVPLWIDEKTREDARALLQKHSLDEARPGYLIMAPGGSPAWPTKRWPLENYLQLTEMIKRKLGFSSVFIGAQAEVAIAKSIDGGYGVINLIGKTSVLESAALISEAKLFLGGDSAPMHLASGFGTPVVAFFGPTDPKRHLSNTHATILKKDLSCAPCYSGKCRIKTHDCMMMISVEETFEKTRKMINTPRS